MIVKTIPPLAKTGRRAGWADLVALTTPGMGGFGLVHVRVTAGDLAWPAGEGACHLIVQIYSKDDVDSRGVPRAYSRPVGTAQRVIRSEEFDAGVGMDIVLLDGSQSEQTAIAWIEASANDTDYDAFDARPMQVPSLGVVMTAETGNAELVLGSHAA